MWYGSTTPEAPAWPAQPSRVAGLSGLASKASQTRRNRRSDGIGTIIKMATIYGVEVGLKDADLMGALLMVPMPSE